MMKITVEDNTNSTTLHVEGKVSMPYTAELERSWERVKQKKESRTLFVDLCAVTSVDETGRTLLRRIGSEGAIMVADNPMMKFFLDELRSKDASRSSKVKP